jgi:FtsZ-binding cell division protein ZapB
VPQFKEKIEAYKRELNKDGAMIVSEETYVEIRSKPDHERSLKEEVQIKVYDAL